MMVVFLPLPVQAISLIAFGETEQAGINQTVPLTAKIETILKDERLAGAVTGISIRKADTGDIIYSSSGDTRLHPASNMKLLTAAAALDTLGTEYRFSTEVWGDGIVNGNTLQGDLFLKGKGDPTLSERGF